MNTFDPADNQNLISNVLEAYSYPFYIFDADTLEIILSNTKESPNFYSQQQEISADSILATSADLNKFTAFLRQVADDGQPAAGKFSMNLASGTGRMMDVHGYPVYNEQQRVNEIIVYSWDITEHQASDAVKNEFISNVSHELRTPITSFLSSAQILKYYWDRLTEEQKLDKIDEIIRGGQNFEALVEDLLALSRIDKHTVKISIEPHDLNALLMGAPELLAEGRDRIITDLTPNLPAVRFDQQLMRDVLINLLENALKFSAPETEVHIRSGFNDSSREVWFSVRDSGIGIAPRHQHKIFERFFRVETVSHSISGTGLGLSISRKYVQIHNGRIMVDSELGKGTIVTVVLPLAEN